MRELKRLKEWLYTKRIAIRLERETAPSGGRKKRKKQPREKQSSQHCLAFRILAPTVSRGLGSSSSAPYFY